MCRRVACVSRVCVVCVSGVSRFLGVDQPSAADVARHAAYVANLVGITHVGIGLDNGFSQPELKDTPPGDFDASYWWPKSAGYGQAISGMHYAPIDTWQQLPEALRAVGMGAGEIELVLGGNMLRVATQVWAAAESAPN